MWFEDQNILRYRERQNINHAKDSLQRQRKNIDPGRIIAELKFGFWTSLFYSHYEQVLWRPIIKKVFPQMNRTIRTRKTLSKRLDKIRKFRNRIFHYEPIWYFNLEQRHAEILEAIGWIEPAMIELLKPVDQFPMCKTQERFEELKTSLKDVF